MFIKKLRQKHLFSQEHLSEISGLSLRTIQRVEQGHRVSYSSLRKLAAAFDIDVDILEREIYAMNDNTNDFIETPLWIRLVLGKGWFFGARSRYEKMTSFFMVSGIVFFMAWISLLFWFTVPAVHELMSAIFLIASVALLLAAYFSTYCIRLGDKYKAWQTLGTRQGKNASRVIIGSFLGLILAVNALSAVGSFKDSDPVETPPWHFLGSNENDDALKDYLATTRTEIFATDGGRKLLRLYEKGLRMGVNPDGVVDLVRLSATSGPLPLSLNGNMSRGDIEHVIGEPFYVSDTKYGKTRVQYLIAGAMLDIDSENVILEILYHASFASPPASHSPASITVLQSDS